MVLYYKNEVIETSYDSSDWAERLVFLLAISNVITVARPSLSLITRVAFYGIIN